MDRHVIRMNFELRQLSSKLSRRGGKMEKTIEVEED